MSKSKEIYQLKVTLMGSQPPIWRRLLVTSDTRLSRLHTIIQVAMGWYDCHLHQFEVDGVYYGVPYDEDLGLDDMDIEDEHKIKLGDIVTGEECKFAYEYDFGDFWEHVILVEKILPVPPDAKREFPVCVKGVRACPPEDVGGVWGYEEFLEAIKDADHPEHDDYLKWVGGDFDPEAFDLDGVNTLLAKLR